MQRGTQGDKNGYTVFQSHCSLTIPLHGRRISVVFTMYSSQALKLQIFIEAFYQTIIVQSKIQYFEWNMKNKRHANSLKQKYVIHIENQNITNNLNKLSKTQIHRLKKVLLCLTFKQ